MNTNGPNEPSQASEDSTFAWSLAANCLLYEADPGPAAANVATSTEPAWTDRSRAWQDRYARYLLEQLEADPARLAAAHAAALDNLREATTLQFARNACRARLRHGAPPRTATQFLSPRSAARSSRSTAALPICADSPSTLPPQPAISRATRTR